LPAPTALSVVWARRHTESSMDNGNATEEGPERLGKVLSIVFLLALAALFVYGYAPRFAISIFG
jgi:hypothetical protein